MEVEESYEDLPYTIKASPIGTSYSLYFKDDIQGSSQYHSLIDLIYNATVDDQIEILLDTNGGDTDTALLIYQALQNTPAKTTACLHGKIYSAGSILVLGCSSFSISPYAQMLIHAWSGGECGKRNEFIAGGDFKVKHYDEALRNIYKGFLSKDEIEEVLMGRDLYLCAEQIQTRLEDKE